MIEAALKSAAKVMSGIVRGVRRGLITACARTPKPFTILLEGNVPHDGNTLNYPPLNDHIIFGAHLPNPGP